MRTLLRQISLRLALFRPKQRLRKFLLSLEEWLLLHLLLLPLLLLQLLEKVLLPPLQLLLLQLQHLPKQPIKMQISTPTGGISLKTRAQRLRMILPSGSEIILITKKWLTDSCLSL
jgi:hypothetical protein